MSKQSNALATGDPEGVNPIVIYESAFKNFKITNMTETNNESTILMTKIVGENKFKKAINENDEYKFHPRISSANCLFCDKEIVFLKNKSGKDIRTDAEFKDFVVTKEDFRFNSKKHHQHKCNDVDFLVKTMKMDPEKAGEIIAKKNSDKAAKLAMKEVNELLEGEDLDG